MPLENTDTMKNKGIACSSCGAISVIARSFNFDPELLSIMYWCWLCLVCEGVCVFRCVCLLPLHTYTQQKKSLNHQSNIFSQKPIHQNGFCCLRVVLMKYLDSGKLYWKGRIEVAWRAADLQKRWMINKSKENNVSSIIGEKIINTLFLSLPLSIKTNRHIVV